MRVAIVGFVTVCVVLWAWAFGLKEQCTTDALCTLDRCPDRCSRPEQLLLLGAGLMAIVSAAFVLGDRVSRRTYLAGAVGLTIVAGTAMFVSAR